MTRTKSIKIRLTEDELRRLKASAGKRGVSSFLRVRALGPDQHQVQSDRLAVLAEFARARNLLNQIARNFQRQPPLTVIEIVSQLIAVERQISNLKKS
jgi:hypothetical protein